MFELCINNCDFSITVRERGDVITLLRSYEHYERLQHVILVLAERSDSVENNNNIRVGELQLLITEHFDVKTYDVINCYNRST